MLVVSHRGRSIAFAPFTGDVASALANGRPYEQEMLQYIEALQLPGAYVDVGAHVGTHALFFAMFCPATRVHAFEPVAEFADLLERNAGANQVADRVELHRIGLSDRVETTSLDFDGGHFTIDCRPLDDVVSGPVSLIKADVEGMEAKVLGGARRILAEHKPLVFVEAHTAAGLEASVAALAPFGYQLTGRVFNNSPTYELASPDSPWLAQGHRLYTRDLLARGWWPQPANPRLLVRRSGAALHIDAAVPEDQHAYLTHDDHAIETPPVEAELIAPAGRCYLQLTGSVADVNAALFVTQYTVRERIKTERTSVHPRSFHEIEIDPAARRLRVALRLAGTGRLVIERLALHTGEHPGRPLPVDEVVAGARVAELSAAAIDAAGRERCVLLFDDPDTWRRDGLLDRATAAGREIVAVHAVLGSARRWAAVLSPAAAGDAQLGWRNARHIDGPLLQAREDEIGRLVGEVHRLAEAAEHRAREQERRRHAVVQRAQRLRGEVDRLQVAVQEQMQAAVQARGEVASVRRRNDKLQKQIGALHQRLISTRRTVAFRIGRAARAAIKNPLTAPARFVRTFRGSDEILVDIERQLAPAPPKLAAAPRTSPAEVAATERAVLLAGLPPAEGATPLVATVSGVRLAAELAAAARTRALQPGMWRHMVEAEPPALLLVTSGGIAPGSAWGSYGTPGGRDGNAALAALIEWCRARQVPTVYWDTLGVPRQRLGLARALHFDAVYSVSSRAIRLAADQLDFTPEILLPGVEPLLYHPDGVQPVPPVHAIAVGSFPAEPGGPDPALLQALLHAGQSHDLRRWQRRSAVAAAATAIRDAGLLLIGQRVTRPDFPSWDLLRGLALGAHVATTPADTGDAMVSAAVTFVTTAATAPAALATLARRPRLGPEWRIAYERIQAAYGLRARLDHIGRQTGVGALAAPPLEPAAAAVASRVEVA